MNRYTKLFGAFALFSMLCGSLAAQTLQNADFEAAAGSWASGEGPPAWQLQFDDPAQRGVVEPYALVEQGQHAFRFSEVARGFGASRLEQCLALNPADFAALQLRARVLVEAPHPDLSVRLRMDFFADEHCDTASAAASFEQIETSLGLSEERAPAGEWVTLESEVRMAVELGEDVRSVHVSLRQRDRSAAGQPRVPGRTVWFSEVSIQGDARLLPAEQRAALRELYEATGGTHWRDAEGWMGGPGSECDWRGVRCSAEGDVLEALHLPRNRLIGELPASLANLVHLLPGEGLDLCWNEILVPDSLMDFVTVHHVGGDPGYCQGLEPAEIHAGRSGSYYQPYGRDGEGLTLHMLSRGSGLLLWASYDDAGEPLWLMATGRARDRVLQFDDLYYTRLVGGELIRERAGRASLLFVDGAEENGESHAVLRFHAEGESFAAGSGRELEALNGTWGGVPPFTIRPLQEELHGYWHSPGAPGESLSLTPVVQGGLWMNWFGHDEHGRQVWTVGVGWPSGDGNRVQFDELYRVTGGSFDEFMYSDDLQVEPQPSARLLRVGLAGGEHGNEDWILDYGSAGQPAQLALARFVAGPELLAATGNRIDLEMTPEDLEELYSRSIWSDDRLPGQVRFNGGEQAHPVALRFRGNSTRMVGKKSFNVRFETAQPLLFGSSRMNLNASYTDPTLMREDLAFEMFDTLGWAASSTRYFDVWINGNYEGTYQHIARVDEHLLALNDLNPGGTLVRDKTRANSEIDVDSVFSLNLGGMTHEERIEYLEHNSKYRGDPAWEHLLEFVEWVGASVPGARFHAEFEARVDLENFIDWMLVHWLIGDVDSWGDDYWLYLDHEDPDARWKFIPWDKDLSFGSHYRDEFFVDNDFFAYEYQLFSGGGNGLLQKVLATPSMRQLLKVRLEELMEAVFPPSWYAQRLELNKERLADSIEIKPGPKAFVLHEANHHDKEGHLEDQVEAIMDFVHLRYAYIARSLATGGPGSPYAAGIEIPAWDEGQNEGQALNFEPLLLTDSTGFTLAWLQPQSGFEQATTVQMTVEAEPGLAGIDRRWQLEVDGPGGVVELSLFYRNEVLFWVGDGNWWTEGSEPVGRQRELELHAITPLGEALKLPVRINPISNKAVAELDLAPGVHEFRLVLPAP